MFLNEHTKMSAAYFLKTKNQFHDALVLYRALVENEQSRPMYRIILDMDGEIQALPMRNS